MENKIKQIESEVRGWLENCACLGRDAYGAYIENVTAGIMNKVRELNTPPKKVWLVIFTSREDWDSPTIVTVRADDRDDALRKAIDHQGISPIEFNEKYNSVDENEFGKDHDYCVIEADVIE